MNASESTDPEEKPLTFTWYVDGVEVTGEGANDVVHTSPVTRRDAHRQGHGLGRPAVETTRTRSPSASPHLPRSDTVYPMNKLNDERGNVIVTAILLMAVMLSLGFAVMSQVDTQTPSRAVERERESTFNLAEAALSAQTFILGRRGTGIAGAPVPARRLPRRRRGGRLLLPAVRADREELQRRRPGGLRLRRPTDGWRTYVRDDRDPVTGQPVRFWDDEIIDPANSKLRRVGALRRRRQPPRLGALRGHRPRAQARASSRGCASRTA